MVLTLIPEPSRPLLAAFRAQITANLPDSTALKLLAIDYLEGKGELHEQLSKFAREVAAFSSELPA